MLNKKTILFFTGTNRSDIAQAVKSEFPADGTVVSVVVERKELKNATFIKIWDKIVAEGTKARQFLRQKEAELTAMKRDGKHRTLKTPVFDSKSFVQRRILNVLNRYTPDVVCVTSYTVLSDVLATVQHYGNGVKVVVFAEDFVLDDRLVNAIAEKYFVDNFSMRNEMIELGVAPEKIEIAELPVLADFYVPGDPVEAQKKLALEQQESVLVYAGEYGDERFINVVKAIKNSDLDVNVVVACGKNAAFLNEVRDLGAYPFNEGLDMNVALDACDVLVTRPNNVLIAEARAKGRKIFALYPNDRTEEENLKYLSLQTVTAVEDEDDLIGKLQIYLSEPAEIRAGQSEEVEKFSARTVANKLVELAEQVKMRG